VAKSHHHNTKTNKTQHTQAAALRPDGTGRQVFFGLLPDVWIRRTRMPVGLTIPSTRHGETTDVPLGDGDSDRDAAHSRSDWLSSRSSTTASSRLQRRQSVPVPVRPGDRSALIRLLPTTATSTQHPAFHWQQRTGTAVPHSQRRQHSRCEAPLRLTQSIRLCAISLSAHCRALTQLNFTSARLFHTAATHCRTRVRSLARSTVNCRLSRNVFASPLKHVLYT